MGKLYFQKVLLAQSQREHLKNISQYLQQAVVQKGYDSPSTSHIIPVIVGESQAAINKAMQVQASGFMPCLCVHQQYLKQFAFAYFFNVNGAAT